MESNWFWISFNVHHTHAIFFCWKRGAILESQARIHEGDKRGNVPLPERKTEIENARNCPSFAETETWQLKSNRILMDLVHVWKNLENSSWVVKNLELVYESLYWVLKSVWESEGVLKRHDQASKSPNWVSINSQSI